MAHVGELVWSSKLNQAIHLGEPVWTHNLSLKEEFNIVSIEGTA